MQLQQVDLFKILETRERIRFYSDIFGLCNNSSFHIESIFIIDYDEWKINTRIYFKDSDGYHTVSEIKSFDIKNIFSLDLFQIRKDEPQKRDYWNG